MEHYVYTLAYPDGRVFYVGKGTGHRINMHEAQARKGEGTNQKKLDVIRAIWASGGEVLKTKVASFGTHEEALAHEVALIASLSDLVNGSAGGEGVMGKRRRRLVPVLVGSSSAGANVARPGYLKILRESFEPKLTQEWVARRGDVRLLTYRNAEWKGYTSYTTAVAILSAFNAALAERGKLPMSLADLGLRLR